MDNKESFQMIAKTMQGLEDVLANEIDGLGGSDIRIGRRSVFFKGTMQLLYKANLQLRTALRILVPIKNFSAKTTDQIYEEVKEIAWEKYFDLTQTFAVDTVAYSETFTQSRFLTYRAKDAISDHFREKFGKRPSVRITRPEIRIHLHISHNECTLALDSSGESLHRRGWRIDQTEAPMNEVLAAGILLLAGWHGQTHFIDPMCGSGTLLVEAALIALNIPPGIYRKDFGFQHWKNYDPDLYEKIYEENTERPFKYTIYGSDISVQAIAIADRNIKNASLSKYIHLKVKPIQEIKTSMTEGIMVTNPPYGERLKNCDLPELYKALGERLKHVFTGYSAWIFSQKAELFNQIGLRPSQQYHLMNGELECEYRKYIIFKGKNKEYKTLKAKSIQNKKSLEMTGQQNNRKTGIHQNKANNDY